MINLIVNTNHGLFSNVLCAMSALHYADDNNLNLNINITNNRYTDNNENIWDLLFNQPKLINPESENTLIDNWTPYGCTFCSTLNETNAILYQNLLKKYDIIRQKDIDICKNFFQGEDLTKVIGIHKRGTDHYLHGSFIPLDRYFNSIDEEIEKNKYEKVFLITDEEETVNLFIQKYGRNLIYTDSFRSTDSRPIHDYSFKNIGNRLFDVYHDALKLSLCDKIIVTSSNVSAFSIIANNNKFKYIDTDIVYR